MKFLPAPAFLICCLSAIPATAADISIKRTSDDGVTITIAGYINLEDEKKFKALTLFDGWLTDLNTTVNLNSRGGFNRPAALIGLAIREKGYQTHVESGSICDSACTLIFLAGAYRSMGLGTRLGFHSAYSETGPKIRSESANLLIAGYLRYMGAPQQIIDLQPKADPNGANYVSRDQAQRWGVLKGRPPPPEGRATSNPVVRQISP
jgi:hypothetical protein